MRASLFSLSSVLCIALASLTVAGCGGGETPPADTARSVTGSSNLSGLWRVVSKIGTTTQRTAATIVDNGSNLSMVDCSLGYRNYALTRDGNELNGYYFNLAPITVTNNDTMTYAYNTIKRDFAKMDRDVTFDMGNFTISSPAFPTVNASSDVCVGFGDSGSAESLIMATRINGEMLRLTINLTNSLRTGTFNIEPYGNAPATVTLEGAALNTMVGTESVSVLQGSLKITKRGTVFVEGTVTGTLEDTTTNVNMSFKAEMP